MKTRLKFTKAQYIVLKEVFWQFEECDGVHGPNEDDEGCNDEHPEYAISVVGELEHIFNTVEASAEVVIVFTEDQIWTLANIFFDAIHPYYTDPIDIEAYDDLANILKKHQ